MDDKIIIFGGTTEGRELSEWLSRRNMHHAVCVATNYGHDVLSEMEDDSDHCGAAKVYCRRMDKAQMLEFMRKNKAEIVIDATHPYAKEATENIRAAAEAESIRYIRLARKDAADRIACRRYYFDSTEECIEALKKTDGNILLTTGSKELFRYAGVQELKERIIVRIIPGSESISECEKNGISGKHIIAMQGPFSVEMNLAVIHSYDIKQIVTKDSGSIGGFDAKAEASEKADIPMYIIRRPEESFGIPFDEVCKKLMPYCPQKKIVISLIGCGMGSAGNMTVEAAESLKSAEVVCGSERLLSGLNISQEKYPYYLSKDIIPILKKERKDAAVLFSGDTGFSSGAEKLYQALQKEIMNGKLNAEVKIYPGITSVSYMAAKCGMKWDDAVLFSTHGKKEWSAELLYNIRFNKKVFTLLSGLEDLKAVCMLLEKSGLGGCRIIAGYQMSYKEEEIFEIKAADVYGLTKEGLYSLFIINDDFESPYASRGIPDTEFIRGSVPMTKEEIREVSVAKLGLRCDSVLFDIGSGTGSIAIQAAGLSPRLSVFAIEKKSEAVMLIRENMEKFGAYNIKIIDGEAPDILEGLPKPTHAFIGGSCGRMFAIIDRLFEMNSAIRIVINAVSIETLQQLLEIERRYSVKDFEAVSFQAVRTKCAGSHTMLKAENPVWVCSFTGDT